MSTPVTIVGAGLGGLVLEGDTRHPTIAAAVGGGSMFVIGGDGTWLGAHRAAAAAAVGELTPEQVVEFLATSGGQS